MEYKLIIEGEGGKIEIDDKDHTVIRKIDFQISQQDKSASERSDILFNDLVIEGVLTDASQKQTKDILDWSLKTDKKSVYKTVSIIVNDAKEKLRDYYLKNMFCVSYREVFDEDQGSGGAEKSSIGRFVLVMKQRKGAIDTIKVEC